MTLTFSMLFALALGAAVVVKSAGATVHWQFPTTNKQEAAS